METVTFSNMSCLTAKVVASNAALGNAMLDCVGMLIGIGCAVILAIAWKG